MTNPAWTPSAEQEVRRLKREHYIGVLLLVGRTACPGCGKIGYLVVRKTKGQAHVCTCPCGWRGKIMGRGESGS